jgi:hypothetical protein
MNAVHWTLDRETNTKEEGHRHPSTYSHRKYCSVLFILVNLHLLKAIDYSFAKSGKNISIDKH